MGSGRAGWYDYDHMDNGGTPSVRHIIQSCSMSRSAISCLGCQTPRTVSLSGRSFPKERWSSLGHSNLVQPVLSLPWGLLSARCAYELGACPRTHGSGPHKAHRSGSYFSGLSCGPRGPCHHSWEAKVLHQTHLRPASKDALAAPSSTSKVRSLPDGISYAARHQAQGRVAPGPRAHQRQRIRPSGVHR